jgi:hypothetical protein
VSAVAKKRGNGDVHDLTVEILRSIRDEIRAMREEMRVGFHGVQARIDNLVEFTGERWRDHEQRLRRLERRRG